MGPDGGDAGVRQIGRRGFLTLVGQAAAAAGVAELVAACGGGTHAPAHHESPAAHRAAAARAARRDAQHFHSRPDLKPPHITLDRPPAALPASGFGDELVFTETHGGPGQQGPLILDRAGNLVWFKALSDHGSARLRAFNVRVQPYRGRRVLTWWQGAIVGAHGEGHYELWNRHYRPLAQVHAANGYRGDLHEFLITEQGTALFTCYGQAQGAIPRHEGGGTRQGTYLYGVVQEVDIATGKLLLQWRSDEHVGVDESYHLPPPPDPKVAWDYFHVNSISVDPADGNLVISGRNTWACYKVHRRTGEVMWRLGGKRSDFDVAPRARFAFQHHVTAHPGGTFTVFDNEGGPPDEAAQSRALVLAVDQPRRTVTLRRRLVHRPAVLSPALGSVQQLDDGHLFVGWGDSSYFTEYDADGDVVLDGHLAAGSISYRAFQAHWRGRPRTRPHVAVKPSATGPRVYASWNGANQHHHWRVLGGGAPDRLAPVAHVPVQAFETEIALPGSTAWCVVEALGAAGHVLSRSEPRRV
jgi:hypothetical protein